MFQIFSGITLLELSKHLNAFLGVLFMTNFGKLIFLKNVFYFQTKFLDSNVLLGFWELNIF